MVGPTLLSFLLVLGSRCRSALQAHHGCQKLGIKEGCFSNLNLSSVPTELDPRLSRLDVSHNAISEINMENMRSLQVLDISYNQLRLIHEGAFRNLFQLNTLNVAKNALYNEVLKNCKAFQDLYNLKSLDLSLNRLNNRAVELYLSNMTSLEHLSLAGNILIKLTPQLFAESPNLSSIDVENNLILEIETGTFEPLKRLMKLNLARNNLVSICEFELHQLNFLNLSRNSIEFFITHQNEAMYQLETLDLSDNNLLYFPVVPKRNHLKNLYLQNNRVGVLKTEWSVSEANSLYKEITNLDDYGKENEDDIYSSLKEMHIVNLDLSNNQFTSFPLKTLRHLVSLQSLNLSSNCVTNISNNEAESDSRGGFWQRVSFPSLQFLDLQRNQIQHLSSAFFEALPNIEKLNLQENHVKLCSVRASQIMEQNFTSDTLCVSFSNVRTLKHLNLQENGIERLYANTFLHTPLASLNLAGNIEMVMEKESLDGLQNTLESLNVGGNKMTSSDFPLRCLKMLRSLNVSGNALDVLPDSVSCSPLKELDLRNNSFVHLDERLINNASFHLDAIYISGNSFNCCNARWLEILREANVKVPDFGKATCFIGLNESIYFNSLYRLAKHCLLQPSTEVAKNILFGILFIIPIGLLIVFVLFLFNTFVKKKTFRSNKVVSFKCSKDNQGSSTTCTFEMEK